MSIFWIVVLYTVLVVILCAVEYKAYIRNGKFKKRAFAKDFVRLWTVGMCIILAAIWEAVKFVFVWAGKIIDWTWALMKFIVAKVRQD